MKKWCTAARLCAGAALLGISAICAADSGTTNSSAAAALKQTLRARYPEVTVVDVKPGPIPGWYEVFTGKQLVYSDAAGDHLFVGKLLDTRTREDLAAEQLEKRLTINFESLPFESAIKIVRGSGVHRLALFEDPDCPYCHALEQQLAGVRDVTLYVFLFPLPELHPQARAHALAIWCAPDRAAAWAHWMQESKAPGASECSGDPIDQLQSIGAGLYVTSTPTIFLPSGQRIQGTVDAEGLRKLLESPENGAAAQPPSADQSRPATDKNHGDVTPATSVPADPPTAAARGLAAQSSAQP